MVWLNEQQNYFEGVCSTGAPDFSHRPHVTQTNRLQINTHNEWVREGANLHPTALQNL